MGEFNKVLDILLIQTIEWEKVCNDLLVQIVSLFAQSQCMGKYFYRAMKVNETFTVFIREKLRRIGVVYFIIMFGDSSTS